MASCQPSKYHSDLPITPIHYTPLAVESAISTTTPASVLAPTPRSSETSVTGNKQSCPKKVEKETSLVGLATGTMVSQDTLTSPPTFLDLQINQKYEAPAIPETFNLEKTVSPDGMLLATIDVMSGNYERSYLRIFNNKAEVLEEITFDIPDLHKIRWLDNQNLLLYTALTPQDGSILLFNPFTRAQFYINNEMPSFLVQSELYPGLRWLVEYSPNLEWGVYLAADSTGDIAASSSSGSYLGPVVYDFSLRKPIWIPKYPINFPEEPKWSPDSNHVVIESENQLNIVTREGKVTPILDESDTNHVFGPLWSPDGNKIAFWNNDSLMLYNIPNDELFDLCFTPDKDHVFPFVWSPDSRYIFIPAYAGENSTLIDIEERLIYSVTASLDIHYPSWMASIP